MHCTPCKKRSQIRTQQKSIGSSQVDIVFFLGIEAVDSQLKLRTHLHLVQKYALPDTLVLQRLSEFLMDNVSNLTSPNKVTLLYNEVDFFLVQLSDIQDRKSVV